MLVKGMGKMNWNRYVTRAIAPALAVLMVISVFAAIPMRSGAEPYESSTSLPALAQGRGGAVVEYFQGKIFVIGGMHPTTATTVDTVMIYNVSTGLSTYGATMAYGVEGAAHAILSNGTIYVFGGYNSTVGGIMTVQAYSTVTNSWSVMGNSMPVLQNIATAAAGLDGRVYVFGGWSQNNATLIYQPTTDIWTYGANLTNYRWAAAALTHSATAIYVIGGGNVSDGAAVSAVDIYNPVTNTWTSAAPMLRSLGFISAVEARNGYIYVFGGVNSPYYDGGTVYNEIERYSIASNTWDRAGVTLSSTRDFTGAVVDEYGRLFVVSGLNGGTTPSANVQMIIASNISGREAVKIVSPTTGSIVSGVVPVHAVIQNPIIVTVLAADFYVDGVLYESQHGNTEWTFSWDTSSLPDNSNHLLKVRVYTSDTKVIDDTVNVTVAAQSAEQKIAALQQQMAVLQAQLAAADGNVTMILMTLAALGATFADLQAQIDDMQEQVDRIEDKADTAGMYTVVNLVLVIIVIVLLALMFVMSRRKP